jgi:hypothetical protein
MSFNIEIPSGTSARLLVGGKYCDRDIVVTATGFDGVYVNDYVTSLSEYTFRGCKWLTGLSCAKLEKINLYACYGTEITFVEAPLLQQLNGFAFMLSKLKSINAPKLMSVYDSAFHSCQLEKCDFPALTNIGKNSFRNCKNLIVLILRSTTMATLYNNEVFTSTPIADGTGYIYVPAALVDTYKADSNWSVYENQIRAIEDYPDICGAETN